MSNDKQDDNAGKQVSEGGGAFTESETEVGGADAVPDKTTGNAPGDKKNEGSAFPS